MPWPNIEEFDYRGIRNDEGLLQIGQYVLLPEWDQTARIGDHMHTDYRVLQRAKAAYRDIAMHGNGDIHAAYDAATSVLRAHLYSTGRKVRWRIATGQYVEP